MWFSMESNDIECFYDCVNIFNKKPSFTAEFR